MKIEMSGIDSEISKVFERLSDDGLRQIAADVIKQWLNTPYDVEYKLAEGEFVRERLSGSRYSSEEDLRKSWEFLQWKNEWKPYKYRFLEKLFDRLSARAEERIEELTKENEFLKGVVDQACETIITKIPNIVATSVTTWVLESIQGAAYLVQERQSGSLKEELSREILESIEIAKKI